MKKMNDEMEIREQSTKIHTHHYLIKGLGTFENMKDLRLTLRVSLEAVRMLMRVGVIKKINR